MMKPAIEAKFNAFFLPEEGDGRALSLLLALRHRQKGLPRGAALAWERAVFCEAFLDPGPARRVRAFLERRA